MPGAGANLNAPAWQKPEVLQDAVEALFPAGSIDHLRGRKRAGDPPPGVGESSLFQGAVLRLPNPP